MAEMEATILIVDVVTGHGGAREHHFQFLPREGHASYVHDLCVILCVIISN